MASKPRQPSRPLCNQVTARGTACRNYATDGSDRCSFHLRRGIASPNVGGRPTVLTPTIADYLVQMLKAGNYVMVACKAAGVSRSTFIEWMRRGTSDAERDEPFRVLKERCDVARAEGEVKNVTQIALAGASTWQAAAWILERQYPERWGRPSTRLRPALEEGEVAAPEAPELEADDDPFAEVDELAERRVARGV